jgi:hypothetical protein
MELYLKSTLSLVELAELAGRIAIPNFIGDLRDGLNLGGGDYFRFTRGSIEVLLVCNDDEYAEVCIPSRSDWPYYFYVWKGEEQILESILEALSMNGFKCELADER